MSSNLRASLTMDGDPFSEQTAAERVYRIPGLLENIVAFLYDQRDYLNLALACKDGFAIPASEFYRITRREILVKSFERGCDSVSSSPIGLSRSSIIVTDCFSVGDIAGSLCYLCQRRTPVEATRSRIKPSETPSTGLAETPGATPEVTTDQHRLAHIYGTRDSLERPALLFRTSIC